MMLSMRRFYILCTLGEVELSWEWVQPIFEAFEENLLPLHEYESGSYGPDTAHALLQESEFKWWLDEGLKK